VSLDDIEVERWMGPMHTVGLTGGIGVGCTVWCYWMEGVMWLWIWVAGKEVKPHFTQFLSVSVVRGVGVFDCSDGCHDDVGMVSVGICQGSSFDDIIALW